MKQKTIYTCEKCRLEITDDFDAMLKHESNHIAPTFQRPKAITYKRGHDYPICIQIEMENGAIVEYYTPIEVSPPTKEESPRGNEDNLQGTISLNSN